MTAAFEMLAEVPLFSLLSDDDRAVLCKQIDVENHKKGHELFAYGDPGDSMMVVVKGEVELFVKNKTGERTLLETVKPGDFFGEITLLDQGPRTASAMCATDVELLVVDREDLDELFRKNPSSALTILAATGKRLRTTATFIRNTATRNENEVVQDNRTLVMRVADWIADFSGSLPFLFIHLGIFFVWIITNVHLFKWGDYDPFPFGLLTMVVSLEAIILSVFVLLSQNRQIERERVRANIEYDVNLKAELQIQQLHEKFDGMNATLQKRLSVLEKNTARLADAGPVSGISKS
jgi:CRP/FNR family cyclic AMP-dependent transcriptional regulator